MRPLLTHCATISVVRNKAKHGVTMLDATRDLASYLAAATSVGDAAEQKTAFMNLARVCQITPQNDFLVETVAGPLTQAVRAAFGDLALIVPLTERRRRQVYFAVLARLEETVGIERLTKSADERLSFVQGLISDRSQDLIARWYGACPSGFLALLNRLGETALPPRSYTILAEFAGAGPEMVRALLGQSQHQLISDEFLDTLDRLPRDPLAPAAARAVETSAMFRRFMDAYAVLTGSRHMRIDHVARLARGERPEHLVEGLYLDVPFPPPVITGPDFRHASSGKELVTLAGEFRNCLGGEVDTALRGECQFYCWGPPSHEPVVFSIFNDAPFGWCLQQCAYRGNARVPPAARQQLQVRLNDFGIRDGRPMGRLMRPFRTEVNDLDFEELVAQVAD